MSDGVYIITKMYNKTGIHEFYAVFKEKHEKKAQKFLKHAEDHYSNKVDFNMEFVSFSCSNYDVN